MSLKQKISEQAKPLYQWIQESYIDAPPPTFSSEQKVLVSVDVVYGLLDKLIEQINDKLSISRKYINTDNVWARKQAQTEVKILEWVLGVVEAEQK